MKVRAPLLLQPLLGTNPGVTGLISVMASALLLDTLIRFQLSFYHLSSIKQFVLIFLAWDLGGGLVANATSSVGKYYEERPMLRRIYFSLHILQPLLLMWLFHPYRNQIAGLTALVLFFCFLWHHYRSASMQREFAFFSFCLSATLLFSFAKLPDALLLLLLVFIIKMFFSVINRGGTGTFFSIRQHGI